MFGVLNKMEKFCLRRIGCPSSVPDVKDSLDIKSDITIIGRNKLAADLFLDSKKTTGLISRMHARIIRNSKDGKDTFDICDTSLNGTYVNDYKISGSVTLKDGDLIAFGHRKGAILEQGAYAPQRDSEFLYKFEKVKSHETTNQMTYPSTCALPLYNGLLTASETRSSVTLPNSSARTITNIENDQPLKQNAVHNLIMQNSQANTPSDDELRSLVSTIVSKNEDESDEEFSISTTPLRGNNNNRNDSNQTTTLGSLGLLKKHKANKRRHSEETPVLPTKIPDGKKRKLVQEKENHKRSRSDDGVKYTHDACASLDCSHPSDATNTWVQCDDCDQWYHVKCAGLSGKAAKKKSTRFHCGC